MTQFKDRRNHPRRMGDGLIVLIGGRGFPLVDISIAGLSFQGSGFGVGDRVTLKIAQLLKMKECVEAVITVVATEETITRGRIEPKIAVMEYIVQHFSDVIGAEPHYFK